MTHNDDSCFRLEVKIGGLKPDEARILYHAILPEIRDIPSKRASARLELFDDHVRLEISASDLVALRAALNSFLRFIDSVLQSLLVFSE